MITKSLFQSLTAATLCVTVPSISFAQDPAADESLSEEEKMEKAKGLYAEAEEYAEQGNWASAVPRYEQAYYLVPSKHGFAFKIGIAAWNSKDCKKADEYLRHFIKWADPEKHADRIAEAKQLLGEIAVSGCAGTEEPAAGGAAAGGAAAEEEPAPAPVVEEDNPLADEMSSQKQRDLEAQKAREDAKRERKTLFYAGIGTMAGGGAAAIFGGVSLLVANSTAQKLKDQSSGSNTSVGFPSGDYSCEDSDCPYALERQLQTWNVLTIVGFAVGGAGLIAGGTMLGVHYARNGSGKNAKAPTGPRLTGIGPTYLQGGGGAAISGRF